MSNKEEFVTISVPMDQAESIEERGYLCPADQSLVETEISKSLAARKSKLDRWRVAVSDTIDLRAELSCHGFTNEEVELMAAAPQMAELLVELNGCSHDYGAYLNHGMFMKIRDAIRGVFPEGVANEILGDK